MDSKNFKYLLIFIGIVSVSFAAIFIRMSNSEPLAIATFRMGISSIILPSTITAIDIDAFKDCVSLKNVQVDHAAPLALTDEVFSGTTDPSTATLHVPTGTTTASQSADKWSAFGTIVEGTLSAESFNQVLNWSFYPNPTSNVVIIENTQEIILEGSIPQKAKPVRKLW